MRKFAPFENFPLYGKCSDAIHTVHTCKQEHSIQEHSYSHIHQAAVCQDMGRLYTNGYVELYHVYQLGQELMGAEKGVVLLLEVLLHLKSGNR